ncbi:MAG: NHLP leader peptide family RiPP precursor [Xanthobacteraceae bacterium]
MANQPGTANPPLVTRRDLEARIVAKAWRNSAYKQRLLADPKAVLQSEISAVDPGVTLPAGLQVQVHEEGPNTYHLVLPRNPKDIALSEVLPDDLEAVAPQTIAVVVVGIGAVVVNTVGAVNNVGAANVVGAGNVATTGNAVANTNTVG